MGQEGAAPGACRDRAATNVYDRGHPKLGHPPFDWRHARPYPRPWPTESQTLRAAARVRGRPRGPELRGSAKFCMGWRPRRLAGCCWHAAHEAVRFDEGRPGRVRPRAGGRGPLWRGPGQASRATGGRASVVPGPAADLADELAERVAQEVGAVVRRSCRLWRRSHPQPRGGVRAVELPPESAADPLCRCDRNARVPRKSPARHQVFIPDSGLPVQVKALVTRNMEHGDRQQELRAVRRRVHAAPGARALLLGPLPGRLEPAATPATPRPRASALDWTITAMRETIDRLLRARGWDQPHALRGDQRGGVVGHHGRRHPGALPPGRLRRRPGGPRRGRARGHRGHVRRPAVRQEPDGLLPRSRRLHQAGPGRHRVLDLAAAARAWASTRGRPAGRSGR